MKRFSAVLVSSLAALVPWASGQNAEPAPAPKTTSAPPEMSRFFPPPLQSFPLYGTGEIPNARPTPDEESGGDRSFVRNVSRPQIDVYLPAPSRANGGSLLIFPGGGYAGLSYDYEGTQQARFFIEHGFAAFVVKYRIPSDRTMENKAIGPLQDAQQALRFVRQHAKDWNLDPARVGAIGYSAGGHVASTLATHFDKAYSDDPAQVNLRPDFLVVVYPVISMDAKITHLDSRRALLGPTPSEDDVHFFSNERHVTKDTPPTLILHAADDRLVDVDNSIVFFQALRHAGVPVEARFFEKGQHGFFLLPRNTWQTVIVEWLASNGWHFPKM